MVFIQPVDLALVLKSAQDFTRRKQDREDRDFARSEHQRKLELARKQQEMDIKVKQAQAKVLQAQTPEAQQAAMGELQAFEPSVAMETQEKLGEFEAGQQEITAKRQTFATKRREFKIDQSLKGAEAMQQLLPSAVQETPAGPQVDIKGLFGATSRIQKMAQQGIVDQGQADAVSKLFDRARQATVAGGQGQLNGEQMSAEMQSIAGDVGSMIESAKQGVDLLGDPEKRQRFNSELEQLGGRAFELGGGENDYEWQAMNNPKGIEQARAERREDRLRRAKATAPRSYFDMGTKEEIAPLTKGARTQILKESASSRKLLDMYRRSAKSAEPWMFKYHGRAKVGLGEFLSRLPGDLAPEGWRGDMNDFLDTYMSSERGFSLYRKKITGAQAAMAELEYLRKQAANMDMSWPRFQAAIRETFAGLQYEVKLYNKALAKGISLQENGELPGGLTQKYFDEMLGTKKDMEGGRARMEGGLMRGSPITRGDMLDRIDALEEAGWSGPEIIEAIEHEGYDTLTSGDIEKLTGKIR